MRGRRPRCASFAELSAGEGEEHVLERDRHDFDVADRRAVRAGRVERRRNEVARGCAVRRHAQRPVAALASRERGAAAEAVKHRRVVADNADLQVHDLFRADRALQRSRRVERDDPAVVDDRYAVAELIGFLHVVRRQQDGAALRAQLADAVAPLARVDTKDADRSARRDEQRREHLHGGGLAGAVRPQEAEDLAALDAKINAVYGTEALAAVGLAPEALPDRAPSLLEDLDEVFRLDGGRRHSTKISTRSSSSAISTTLPGKSMFRSSSSRSMPNFPRCPRTTPLDASFILPIRAMARGIATFTFCSPSSVTRIRRIRPRPPGPGGGGGTPGGEPGCRRGPSSMSPSARSNRYACSVSIFPSASSFRICLPSSLGTLDQLRRVSSSFAAASSTPSSPRATRSSRSRTRAVTGGAIGSVRSRSSAAAGSDSAVLSRSTEAAGSAATEEDASLMVRSPLAVLT